MQLITSPQNFTASWADLGGELDCTGATRVGIYLVLDINDTLNARVRVLGKHTKAGSTEFTMPIKTASASDVAVESEYVEFTTDADQNMVLEVVTNGIIPFLQFQISAGTAGASPGQVDEADIVFSNVQ